MIHQLQAGLDRSERLRRLARGLDTTFLFESGIDQYLVELRDGRIARVLDGPLVFPSWNFALRAGRDEWEAFWQPHPTPGHHDLFAMLKRGALVMEGDLHPFMANLRFFKELLALPRGGEEG